MQITTTSSPGPFIFTICKLAFDIKFSFHLMCSKCARPHIYTFIQKQRINTSCSQIQFRNGLLGSVRGGWRLHKAETVSQTSAISMIILKTRVKIPMCTDCESDQRWKKCSRHWNGDCPAAHGENHTGADRYTAAHWGMLCWEEIDMPWRKLHRQTPVACEGTNIKLVSSWRTVSHEGDPHWNSS